MISLNYLHTSCLVFNGRSRYKSRPFMPQNAKSKARPKTASISRAKSGTKRLGKRSAAESRETRKLLLQAAAAAFAEHGFSGAKIDDIATRAGVTKGAIYSHFDGREDLLVQASRAALRELKIFQLASDAPNIRVFIRKTAEALLTPRGKAVRMLNVEVHLSAARSKVMSKLLADWYAEGFETLQDRLPPKLGSPEAVFTLVQCLLLGLSHIDALSSVGAKRKDVLALVDRLSAGFVGGRNS